MARAKKPRARGEGMHFMLRVRLTEAELKALQAAGDDMSSTVRRALALMLGERWPTSPRY